MSRQDHFSLVNNLGKLSLNHNRKPPKPVEVSINTEMLLDILKALEIPSQFFKPIEGDKIYELVALDKKSTQFKKVKVKFTSGLMNRTTKSSVRMIQMVLNPYIAAQYKLKQYKKADTFNLCQEMLLYHGTWHHNLDSICEENYNWRCTNAHMYGQRVSFAKYPTYASYYPRELVGKSRVMILSKVLYTWICNGDPSMQIPKGSSDTSGKPNRDVIVKYEDADYYPLYIIHYHLLGI
ncbi:protein mono-ADP-ribosyltransferase PARP11-like [Cylas formicarius]|uniref:protein mono-ADP-ribosyltransferase PARP11-like n=1 Tax=Cylas formicarius TaxID=197179 RepID=UPI002958AA7B|nr:protein mono-ADP-ribosyltransferase PARP11-like [Cylas formicarius]